MELRRIPWTGDHRPGEARLRRELEADGWDVSRWTDPSDRVYEAHTHAHDESLWVVGGRIVLEVGGQHYPLGPGDRLDLPRQTLHTARAGPDGARYLIGQRRA